MQTQESKLRLKAILVLTAEQECAIEKLRQTLCSMPEFEPYTAFRRLDRRLLGVIDRCALCQFLRENGFRELEPDDFTQMVEYFDLDKDKKLNYHDFLQILLPCQDPYLRAAATQRPSRDVGLGEFLPMKVERALSQLLFKEVRYQLKVDELKRHLENAYDYSLKRVFYAVDDWTYGWWDKSNIRRFLRKTGYICSNEQLVAILRRFDIDGDAKINFKEFELGIKSSLTTYAGVSQSANSAGASRQKTGS
jgi:Ca2+-binding EF-hand superfamily protein